MKFVFRLRRRVKTVGCPFHSFFRNLHCHWGCFWMSCLQYKTFTALTGLSLGCVYIFRCRSEGQGRSQRDLSLIAIQCAPDRCTGVCRSLKPVPLMQLPIMCNLPNHDALHYCNVGYVTFFSFMSCHIKTESIHVICIAIYISMQIVAFVWLT